MGDCSRRGQIGESGPNFLQGEGKTKKYNQVNITDMIFFKANKRLLT